MELKNFSSEADFVTASADVIASICSSGRVSIALSGGATPAPIYSAFSKKITTLYDLHIDCYQVDERHTTPDSADSNQRLLTETLLGPMLDAEEEIPICVHFFNTHLPLAEAVGQYEKDIRKIQFKGGFDLCVLGLGMDGHTASLFPHSEALHETDRLVTHTETDQFPVHDRLTLTFPAIMGSKKLLLLIQGQEKKQILDELLHGDKSIDELPAKKLLEHPDLTIHYCTN